MTPQELLAKGVEVIERDGWTQGDLYEHPADSSNMMCMEEFNAAMIEAARTAPVCSFGAIYRAAYGTCRTLDWDKEEVSVLRHVVAEARHLLSATIVDRTGRHWNDESRGLGNVPGFNDDPSTTKEDVVLAFKAAAHGG